MTTLKKIFLGLLLVSLMACGAGSSSSLGGAGGDDGGGTGGVTGGDDGGGGGTAGLRPPSLPPEASNPTLKLAMQVSMRIDGIADVSLTVTRDETANLSAPLAKAEVPVAGTEVFVAVMRDDEEVDTDSCVTDADGTCDVEATGVVDADFIWAAGEDTDTENAEVSLIGDVTTLAGKAAISGQEDGVGTDASFNGPHDAAIDSTGTFIYVSDTMNNSIRKIATADGTVTSFVGAPAGSDPDLTCGDTDETGTNAEICFPYGIVMDLTDTYLYFCDWGNNKVKRITVATGETSVFVGSPEGFALDGCEDGMDTDARFAGCEGLTIDRDGAFLYVADTSNAQTGTTNNRIRKVDIATQEVTTAFGPACADGDSSGFVDGAAADALFNRPINLAVDPTNSFLYISDVDNNAIRRADLSTNEVTTIIGSTDGTAGDVDGIGTAALLNSPRGLTLDPTNEFFYIQEQNNNKIRRSVIDDAFDTAVFVGPPVGDTTAGCRDGTGIGTGADAPQFTSPTGLVVAPDGSALYIMNADCNLIQKVVTAE